MNTSAILSTKLTSQNIKNATSAGFIDKLELDAKALNLHKEDLMANLKSLGKIPQDGKFRSGGQRISFKSDNGTEIFAQYRYSTNIIFKLIFNPSSYSCYQNFSEDCFSLIGNIQDIELLPITRIDKTIDLTYSFFEVVRGLNVMNKRSMSIYHFMNAQIRGLYLGKMPLVIKIYDRTTKAKLNFPCTRIEISIQRGKILESCLLELKQNWIFDSDFHDCFFDKVSFNDLEFKQASKRNDSDKLNELKVLADYIPYNMLRSCLTNNGNFQRDYGRLIDLRPWTLQPSTIFNTGMRKFFNPDASGVE